VVFAGEGPRVDLPLAMKWLGEREIAAVLLEGGGRERAGWICWSACLFDLGE